MTKKQKRDSAALAALLLLLLGWRLAQAKTAKKPKITVGPITVETVTEEEPEQPLREQRARYRNQILDFIGFDEDAWGPTRRPSTADNIVIDGLFSSLAGLRYQIPDPENYDAEFDAELLEMVKAARALDPRTTSNPPLAFGSSRYMTRRLDIEEQVYNLVALLESGEPSRRPTDGELAVINRWLAEYAELGDKLLDIDPDADLEGRPLATLVARARSLPPSTSQRTAQSKFSLTMTEVA